jgi:hypothetical protein
MAQHINSYYLRNYTFIQDYKIMDETLVHSGVGYAWKFKPQMSTSQKRKTKIERVP